MTRSLTERPNNSVLATGERRVGDAAFISATLEQTGRVSLRVQGSSMLPWVRPGDITTIRKISLENVRCGDLILFRRDGCLFVHRIVEKRGSLDTAEYLAKGDAHLNSDGVLGRQEVLGRVVRILRGNKRFDLDAPGQLALGLLVSQISARSRLWYPLVSLVARITRPARRFLRASFLPNAAPR